MPNERPERATHRWQGYDYANEGAYYLTICTQDRLHLFGSIKNKTMFPSLLGELVKHIWDGVPEHMPHVGIDEFVVMPNHVHGIVIIRERLADMRGNVALDAGGVGADHDRPANETRTDGVPKNDNIKRFNDGLPSDVFRSNENPIDGSIIVPSNGQLDPDHDDLVHHDVRAEHNAWADHDRPLRTKRPMPIVPVGSLGRIVRTFKSSVTRIAYRNGLLPQGTPVWQRNYWDRVIRDAAEHERIAQYIAENPEKWNGDRFNTP